MNPTRDTITFWKVGDFTPNLLHNASVIASHSAPDIRSSIPDVLPVGGIDPNRFNLDEHPVIMNYGHEHITDCSFLQLHHNDSFGGSHLGNESSDRRIEESTVSISVSVDGGWEYEEVQSRM